MNFGKTIEAVKQFILFFREFYTDQLNLIKDPVRYYQNFVLETPRQKEGLAKTWHYTSFRTQLTYLFGLVVSLALFSLETDPDSFFDFSSITTNEAIQWVLHTLGSIGLSLSAGVFVICCYTMIAAMLAVFETLLLSAEKRLSPKFNFRDWLFFRTVLSAQWLIGYVATLSVVACVVTIIGNLIERWKMTVVIRTECLLDSNGETQCAPTEVVVQNPLEPFLFVILIAFALFHFFWIPLKVLSRYTLKKYDVLIIPVGYAVVAASLYAVATFKSGT